MRKRRICRGRRLRKGRRYLEVGGGDTQIESKRGERKSHIERQMPDGLCFMTI